jgi:hypothetical protein
MPNAGLFQGRVTKAAARALVVDSSSSLLEANSMPDELNALTKLLLVRTKSGRTPSIDRVKKLDI